METLRECVAEFAAITQGIPAYSGLRLARGLDSWAFDDIEDFYAEYRDGFDSASAYVNAVDPAPHDRFTPPGLLGSLSLMVTGRNTDVSVSHNDRRIINRLMSTFQDRQEKARLDPLPSSVDQPLVPAIFIGHGRDSQWRDLKDHLGDHHGYRVVAFESGARAGHVIRDVLTEMIDQSSFAILVMTGEDETADGGMRARQNVVHEAGLFQGRLGFHRAIVLVEDDVEVFSNVQGVNQIRFSKGNIRETYGEVLATLRREFGDSR